MSLICCIPSNMNTSSNSFKYFLILNVWLNFNTICCLNIKLIYSSSHFDFFCIFLICFYTKCVELQINFLNISGYFSFLIHLFLLSLIFFNFCFLSKMSIYLKKEPILTNIFNEKSENYRDEIHPLVFFFLKIRKESPLNLF